MARILIADDYPLTVEMLKSNLQEEGHEVITASDGSHVNALVESEDPDLLILDIYMPEQDGIKTIVDVKKRWPDLPVICISGGGQFDFDYSDEMMQLGASAFFAKPVNTDSLLSVISNLLK